MIEKENDSPNFNNHFRRYNSVEVQEIVPFMIIVLSRVVVRRIVVHLMIIVLLSVVVRRIVVHFMIIVLLSVVIRRIVVPLKINVLFGIMVPIRIIILLTIVAWPHNGRLQ